MRVAYLAIGDELLGGEIREGNGLLLIEELARTGHRVSESRILGDELDEISEALAALSREPTLIVISGGLGPTDDDCTRDAVARAAARPLVLDDEVAEVVRARYESRGRPFHRSNLRQAFFPAGATVLANDAGTAPGFALHQKGSVWICLPGVPREFRWMLGAHLPTVMRGMGLPLRPRDEVCLRVFGATESEVAETLAGLDGRPDVHVRSLPSFPELRLMISAKEDPDDLMPFVDDVRRALGWRIFSDHPKEPYAASLVRALESRGLTLATAESCTGGLVGHLVTAVSGASAVYTGGVVAYADEVKVGALGVPTEALEGHGAVSDQVAHAMAEGARALLTADVAVATTGIAGPSGGSAEKPVGTVHIAVSNEEGTTSRRYHLPGLRRSAFKELVAYMALARVRRSLDG